MAERTRPGAVFQGLVAMASLVVIVAGLKAASDIILPTLFSAFLAILGVPLVRFLHQRLRVPHVVGIPVVVLLFAAGLVGITALIAQTVRGFTADIGQYEPQINALLQDVLTHADRFGLKLDASVAREILQPELMMGVLSQTLNALIVVLSRLLIVLVTMTFILFEATELELKFRAAFGTEARPAGPFTDTTGQVQRYLMIKSVASAATGLFITVGCSLIGLEFPVMWGLIAFLFNYVPSIGSIVAAIPPILLAVVQLSPAWAVVVLVLYLVVNVTIGNFLEPRFMGRQLGLSPLVVFLSLLFWGWVWGPVGMLFCIPMTVIAKLFLESQEDTRWIAVFLGSPREILDVEPS
ncbi:MAG: AI-2E family transporter [Alphaproteobacteria bacterium]|nr:AI-2E family transporter [Alphaproteobacteria bacterium]